MRNQFPQKIRLITICAGACHTTKSGQMLRVWCQVYLITTKCCVDVRLINLKIKFHTAVFWAQLKVPGHEISELMFYTMKVYPIHRGWKKYFC
jgi:hypothetical protein